MNGQGKLALQPSAGFGMFPGTVPDGYVTVTLDAPGTPAFIIRGSNAQPANAYYMDANGGNLGVFALQGGAYQRVVTLPGGGVPVGTAWVLHTSGDLIEVSVDGTLRLSVHDPEYTLPGRLGFHAITGAAGPVTIASILVQTAAQVDAAYAAAHPPAMTITGVG